MNRAAAAFLPPRLDGLKVFFLLKNMAFAGRSFTPRSLREAINNRFNCKSHITPALSKIHAVTIMDGEKGGLGSVFIHIIHIRLRTRLRLGFIQQLDQVWPVYAGIDA